MFRAGTSQSEWDQAWNGNRAHLPVRMLLRSRMTLLPTFHITLNWSTVSTRRCVAGKKGWRVSGFHFLWRRHESEVEIEQGQREQDNQHGSSRLTSCVKAA